MEYGLRLAKEKDLPCVAAMYSDARSYEGCAWDLEYPNEEILRSDFEKRLLYVLVVKNKTIGAISIVNTNELDNFLCWKIQSNNAIEFARVVISRDYLGKGYGTKMVFETLRLLSKMGYDVARILVSPTNHSAIAIYKKTGFDFLKIESFEYGDFWLCEKSLREDLM